MEDPNRSKRPSEEGKELECSGCGKRFARRYHLKRHVNRASCSKSLHLSLPHEVDVPLRSHRAVTEDCRTNKTKGRDLDGALADVPRGGRRPHKCPHCLLRFSQKGTLNRHVVTHLQVLPFECQQCGKRYAQAGSLKLHLFSHTRENGFTCPVCERRFARKHTLQLHVQGVHRRERPHECALCKKRYARRDDLRVHSNTCGRARRIRLVSLLTEIFSGNTSTAKDESYVNLTPVRKVCGNEKNSNSDANLPTSFLSLQEKLRMQRSILTLDSLGASMKLEGEQLTQAVEKLLLLLVGEVALARLGWPNTPTEDLLREVTRSCGCVPVEKGNDTLRENCRLFFGSFLEEDVVRKLLGTRGTIDDVVGKLLRLRKIW